MIDSNIKPTGSFNRRDFAKATAATVEASSLSMTGLVAPAFSQEKLPKAEKRAPLPDAEIVVQAVNLPEPIKDGRYRSGMPYPPAPYKAPKKKSRK